MSEVLRRFLPAAACLGALLPAQTDWQRLPLQDSLRYPAFAFDTLRAEAVLFGGEADTGQPAGTWIWDRAHWRRAEPAHAPPSRTQSAMVFDQARGVLLLFGGRGGYQNLGDTWQFDGVDWTLLLPPQSPPPRCLHAMVFDAPRATVLLFAGAGATLPEFADTWEWNGSTWTQRTPLHSPPGRSGAAMACDSQRQRVVLFGGSCFNLGPCWRGDTWEWNGSDWLDRTPPPTAPSPPARWSHGMAFDTARARTVLFGGSDEPNHYKDDTWEWDGSTWTEVLAPTRPVGRLGFGMDWDPASQRALVFAGETWIGLVADLWRFDGAAWQLDTPPMQPPPMLFEHTCAAAFDGGRGEVLWAGLDYNGSCMQSFAFDGARWWTRAAGGPPIPEHHRLAWLPTLDRVVLYQPQRSVWQPEQTWLYDGQQWTQQTPVHQPGVQEGAALALDPRLDRVVLFGGRDAAGLRGSTFTFDGVDWQQVASSGPSPREGHAMAHDLLRSRTVLFGGRDAQGHCADTFEWDGQQWRQRQPAHAPPARRDHAMAYDLGRRRVVLYGGNSPTGLCADTWEWDGDDWLLRPTAHAPTPDAEPLLAYDFRRGESIAVHAFHSGTYRYAPLVAAALAGFGRPCGGSAGVPLIWAAPGQQPYTGGTCALQFLQLPPGTALGLLGFSNTSWNGAPLPLSLLPFGYPRCDLLVEPAAVASLPVHAGSATWTLSLPSMPALAGLHFYLQAMALDPSGPDGLAMTAGLAGVIGGR